MENQTIKQTENLGNVVGLLKEKNLEIADVRMGDQVETCIRGDIMVQVKNKYGISEVKIRIFQKQFYNNGKENKAFKVFKKVMDEYKDIKEYGEEADAVEVIVSVSENNYYSEEKNDIVETLTLTATTDFDKGLFTPIKRVAKDVPQSCKIGFEGYISKVENKENGEVDIEIIGVGYGSKAIKNKLTVGKDLAIQFQKTYTQNCSAKLFYVIINEVERKKETENLGFGEGSDIVIEKINRKNLVVGGSLPDYDKLKADQVTLVMRNRNIDIQEIIDKGRKKKEEGGQPSFTSADTDYTFPDHESSIESDEQNPFDAWK